MHLAAVGLSCGTLAFLVEACKLLVAACGIYFLDQGSNLGPLHWELGVLATGPSGKSHKFVFYICEFVPVLYMDSFVLFFRFYT